VGSFREFAIEPTLEAICVPNPHPSGGVALSLFATHRPQSLFIAVTKHQCRSLARRSLARLSLAHLSLAHLSLSPATVDGRRLPTGECGGLNHARNSPGAAR